MAVVDNIDSIDVSGLFAIPVAVVDSTVEMRRNK